MPRVKGSIVRAWIRAVEKLQLVDTLRPHLSPPTLAVLTTPPLVATWSDQSALNELFLVTHEVCGRAMAMQLARLSTQEIFPTYASLFSGLIKLFGVSPATFFVRLNEWSKQLFEGATIQYTSISDRTGTLEFAYDRKFASPLQFLTLIPAMESIFQLCRVNGTVSEPEVLSLARARFHVRW